MGTFTLGDANPSPGRLSDIRHSPSPQRPAFSNTNLSLRIPLGHRPNPGLWGPTLSNPNSSARSPTGPRPNHRPGTPTLHNPKKGTITLGKANSSPESYTDPRCNPTLERPTISKPNPSLSVTTGYSPTLSLVIPSLNNCNTNRGSPTGLRPKSSS